MQKHLVLVGYPFEALCVASLKQLMPAVSEWVIYKELINDAFGEH